ncbi:MAG: 3-isopropylmalate dehydrogenase, partial [Polynucleobacter sp. 24-46-87]
MSSKLPINNSQTITDFLNLQKSQLAEESSEDSYKFAFDDEAFLARRETLGLRFQLELLKPEILLHERGIDHTITVFGSTRFVS